MANTKEIKNRISSVKDTQKITGAMYMISSNKMRKARRELEETKPYFEEIDSEIKRIFRISENILNRYFFPPGPELDYEGTYGILAITADKGLAGAYNQNVIKTVQQLMKVHEDVQLFVVGEYGRRYFDAHNIPMEKTFLHTAQNPTLHRAREIATDLLYRYNRSQLAKIFIVYTDFSGGGGEGSARSTRLLPFHRHQFYEHRPEGEETVQHEFLGSIEEVLDGIVPSYLTGFIYSALVDSFCSEQNARMTAMDAANQNAEELLADLQVQYNHMRQNAITQEITEIASGAKGLLQAQKR